MRTAIIGSGNVAEALALALKAMRSGGENGSMPELVQICARNRSEGSALAAKAGVGYVSSPEELAPADLCIIAVSDGAIPEVSAKIRAGAGTVVAHTAGGVGLDAISPHIAHRGVIYPFQTFTKGREADFSNIPIFVEYGDTHAESVVERFASALSGKVFTASSQTRARLHLAGVFGCNFVNHMYAVAARILEEEGLPFDIIKPLIEETAAKALAAGYPAAVQTGPAVRGDTVTLERHMRLLESGKPGREREMEKRIYDIISKSIWETSKKR